MRFALISDIHIRNFKYHEDYKEIFKKVYDVLEKEKVDVIINLGDTAHSKNILSPEYVKITTDFLANLSIVAPTYIVLGNHDGLIKNPNRLDAISPLLEGARSDMSEKLVLLKDSESISLNNKMVLNYFSRFDNNWKAPEDPNKINIALFHGTIKNAMTDAGHKMEHGDIDLNLIKMHDFAFLGDIHKRQAIDNEGRYFYVGSLIQQNFGEEQEKGLIIFDIQGKNKWKSKFVPIEHPKPFVSIILDKDGKISDDEKVQKNAKLRLIAENNISIEDMRKAIDVAKERFLPDSITFLNRAKVQINSTSNLEIDNFDIHDVEVQNELIEEYLSDYKLNKEVLEQVFELNSKYDKTIKESEEILSHNLWTLKELRWNNLYNYNDDNIIDFTKLNGIIGTFGKNFSGKSSIFDALVFALFGVTSKGERKNVHIINQNKSGANCYIKFVYNNNEYEVFRELKKVKKVVNKVEVIDALMSVDLKENGKIINGETRFATDQKIQNIIGSPEQFFFTSMASQLESLSFIQEGNTKRKEILARFLGLDMFDKKFQLAHNDAAELKSFLKRNENVDFNNEIKLYEDLWWKNVNLKNEINHNIIEKQKHLEDVQWQIFSLDEKLNTEIKIIDINSQVKQQFNLNNSIDTLNKKINNKANEIKNLLIQIALLEQKKEELAPKLEFANKQINAFKAASTTKERLQDKLKIIENEIRKLKKQIKVLEEAPCGGLKVSCALLKNAKDAKEELQEVEKEKEQTLNKLNEINLIDIEKYVLIIEESKKINSQLMNLKNELNSFESLKFSFEKEVYNFSNELEKVNILIGKYNISKIKIEEKKNFLDEKGILQKEHAVLNEELRNINEQYKRVIHDEGAYAQQKKMLEAQKNEYDASLSSFNAYNLFLKSMHPNGIPYDIIKQKLPIINEEIAKILSNIIDFEVFFESDGTRLDIFIKHPKFEKLPIEIASGAQKAIASIAIRLALLEVSTLPRSNFMILDEPGTSLDADNLDNFTKILDIMRSKFDIIFLISHIEFLKDCCDSTIEITKEGSYAHVEV